MASNFAKLPAEAMVRWGCLLNGSVGGEAISSRALLKRANPIRALYRFRLASLGYHCLIIGLCPAPSLELTMRACRAPKPASPVTINFLVLHGHEQPAWLLILNVLGEQPLGLSFSRC